MPHIVVHMIPGHSEAEKQDLTRELVRSLKVSFGSTEDEISVDFIEEANWPDYYRAEIAPKLCRLRKDPGYHC